MLCLEVDVKLRQGLCDVMVEERSSDDACFGKGQKKKMTFGKFLEGLESGHEHLYLSAQDAEIDANGFPSLMSPPLTALKDSVCLRPSLLGHLVPQQLNIWMGCSQHGIARGQEEMLRCLVIGASSGLHHDYHDNLYVLLKGSKHFSLFPPSKANHMYTHGRIKQIHENGRIVYHGQGEVNADGSDPIDVARWQKHQNRQHEVTESCTSESELEDILDRHDEERDDYVPSENSSSTDQSDASEGHQTVFAFQVVKNVHDCPIGIDEDPVAHRLKRHKGNSSKTFEDDRPLNFSQVDLMLPLKEQKKAFPNFPGLSEAIECQMTEGQMLYLPAGLSIHGLHSLICGDVFVGWFHNVTSLGLSGKSGIHLALNYWCYPPDNLPTDLEKNDNDSFSQPYLSNYWSHQWEARIAIEQEEGNDGNSGKWN